MNYLFGAIAVIVVIAILNKIFQKNISLKDLGNLLGSKTNFRKRLLYKRGFTLDKNSREGQNKGYRFNKDIFSYHFVFEFPRSQNKRDFVFYSLPHNHSSCRGLWKRLFEEHYTQIEEPDFKSEGFEIQEIMQDRNIYFISKDGKHRYYLFTNGIYKVLAGRYLHSGKDNDTNEFYRASL